MTRGITTEPQPHSHRRFSFSRWVSYHVDALHGWDGAPRRGTNAGFPPSVNDLGRQR